METIKGKVKWFNPTKGFGFIERDDKEKDVFLHSSAIRKAGLTAINEGEVIEFGIEQREKGPSAINLKIINS
jgi:CspA family cold shock protein